MSRLSYLRDVLGFDRAEHVPFTRTWRVRCSRCSACTVNDTPIHERGCPNDTRGCSGCGARVPSNVKFCKDCQ